MDILALPPPANPPTQSGLRGGEVRLNGWAHHFHPGSQPSPDDFGYTPVEYLTADYPAWYNQQRLIHRLGRVPPAQAEANYYSQTVTGPPAGSQNPEGA